MVFFEDGKYKCFGCGSGGSSIDFTAAYFGIGEFESAKMLAADFGIDAKDPAEPAARMKERLVNRLDREGFEQFLRFSDGAIAAAIRYWKAIKDEFSPGRLNGEFSELFKEACDELMMLEDLDERFLFGSETEQVQIMIEYFGDFQRWRRQFMPNGTAWDNANTDAPTTLPLIGVYERSMKGYK